MNPSPLELPAGRLLLRRLQPGDAAALCAYRSLPAVARYQSWHDFGHADATRLIDEQSKIEPGLPGTWLQLAIVKANTNELIGDCGLHFLQTDARQMEFGITLAPRHQGRRYADEVIACLLDYAFGQLGKHRVFAQVDVLNRPAIALCQRMGFRREAHFVENIWFKGGWGSEYLFALLSSEWKGRPKT